VVVELRKTLLLSLDDLFDSAASLKATLKRFVYLYNRHIPQKDLHHKTPLHTLQQWQAQQPHLFKQNPRNHPGPCSLI